MLAATLVALALAATGFAQIEKPAGYSQVVITSSWNEKFVLQPAAPVKTGSNIVLMSRKDTVDQQWYLQSGSTKIQLANTTLCLDAGANRANGSPLTVTTCADNQASQKWVYNADQQIVLDQTGAKLCADLYMGAVRDNTRIVIWQCIAGDKNHIWGTANVTTAV
ncbi:ricin B lectin domain-containing protein [Durotheca rogersii]|uniref:ricin B lectin domain-containing protein n=1 Tax=Durotheca rogersii TaxID=419775 RepID=UPI002220B155|nr:ricin B lectin domain-containing protein [Durotheca rogersii]KAI5859419.1 ricin B lectin domain-containing protein [Durotheca rogersii]